VGRAGDWRDDCAQIHEPRECDLGGRHDVSRCNFHEHGILCQPTHSLASKRPVRDEANPVIPTILGHSVPRSLSSSGDRLTCTDAISAILRRLIVRP
jgi:hypothetical protein